MQRKVNTEARLRLPLLPVYCDGQTVSEQVDFSQVCFGTIQLLRILQLQQPTHFYKHQARTQLTTGRACQMSNCCHVAQGPFSSHCRIRVLLVAHLTSIIATSHGFMAADHQRSTMIMATCSAARPLTCMETSLAGALLSRPSLDHGILWMDLRCKTLQDTL